MLYSVSFISNGNFLSNMCVSEDMLFKELASKFCEYYGLKEDNKPTFFFNSVEIKADSTKKLKELGIFNMASIHVKTEKPFNIIVNIGNMGNFQMNNFGFLNMFNRFMNYGSMNMENGNMNMEQNIKNQNTNNSSEEFLDIIFHFNGGVIYAQSTKNTKFCDLYKEFRIKANNPLLTPTFYFNNIKIESTETKTLTELNIGDKAIIKAVNECSINSVPNIIPDIVFWNILFICQGKYINIQATENCKMCDLIKRFKNKAGVTDREVMFILNSSRVDSTDTRTLKELHLVNLQKIEVIFPSEVIGA